MATLVLKLTDAGLASVQAASGSDPTIIAFLGLTNAHFDYAPTLTALPGEFKRLDVASGLAAAPNITHLTAYDTSADAWTSNGFGLFLDDGTLFAVHTSASPVLSKVSLAFALLAFDIAFEADFAANISYGNAVFAYPPATEQERGVARLATQARVNAADDSADDGSTIVTPRTLRARLASFTMAVNNSIAAISNTVSTGLATLAARQITGGGLVSGGGSLEADLTFTVTEASAAEITAGTVATTVVTPRRLGPISMLLEQNGYIRFFGFQIAWGRFSAAPNVSTGVVFAQPFNTSCFSAVVSGVTSLGTGSQENTPAVVVSTITKTGFSAFNADDEADATCYIAVGT
jgi:hypothetical protein